jgi:hypothetical protein
MLSINYQKRKNTELFKSLENSDLHFISNLQNYIPIYKKFFSLNESNYNSINLNHKWFIYSLNKKNDDNYNLYNCKIKNINNNKIKDKDIFFKYAPLLDPYKFLIGKYNVEDKILFSLPKLNSTELDCQSKFLDLNNSAYIDSLFVYLSSNLLNNFNFIHGLDYYGSFLGIKNDFIINVYDDLDYLNNSDFFIKNKNILFKIDDYEHLFKKEEKHLKPIIIQHNVSSNSLLSIKSFNDEIFSDLFVDKTFLDNFEEKELIDITNSNLIDKEFNNQQVTLKSNSTCSSRSSYTEDNFIDEECGSCKKINNNKDEDSIGNSDKKYKDCDKDCDEEDEDKEDEEDDEDDDDEEEEDEEDEEDEEEKEDEEDDEDEEEEEINVIIPKFPVQIIAMENCENTFDELILTEDLSIDEWYSSLMQIIMILISYQKAFNFTHNDLHTNNVMYNYTENKYIYYCYKKKYYKVPTFGRIFKIIDFGRSIYKLDGKLFCSDSFQIGGDAATQYNTEPYLNDKKPRLEPNFSFDLCRLACSIFDYIIDDFEEVREINKCNDPIKKLIVEWCLDDKGINILYKNNGTDRYPDFKLYKMIARCVHNHTPQAQLERPEFDIYSKFKGNIPQDVIDIDNIPCFT